MAYKLYAYHIPDLKVVKVGKGHNPVDRMRNYAKSNELHPDTSSLRVWEIDYRSVADIVEKTVHNKLERVGHLRYKHWRSASEMFCLNDTTYPQMVTFIDEAIHNKLRRISKRWQKMQPETPIGEKMETDDGRPCP